MEYLNYTSRLQAGILQVGIVSALCVAGLSACGGSSSSGGGGLPAPQGLSAEAGNASLVLDWSDVEDATAYNIYYATDPDVDIDNPGSGSGNWDWISDVTPPHTVDTLDNGVPYYLVVTATDNSRESAPSNEITATPRAGVSGRDIKTQGRIIGAQSYEHSVLAPFCEEGKVAAGGGFRIISSPTSQNEDAPVQIHSSFPTSTGAASNRTYSWNGRAFNDKSPADGSVMLQSQVICIDEPDDFEYIRNTGLTLDAGTSDVFGGECTQGNTVITGGALLGGVNSDDPGIRLSYSQRDEDTGAGWSTKLHNVSADDHTNLSANTVCAAPLRGFSVETSHDVRPEGFVPAGSFGERTVRCDAGQVVLHGGLHRSGDAESQSTDLVLQQSHSGIDAQDRHTWRVKVFNSAAEPRPMGAFAVCADSDD
ncbi:fibronectin type III domain-containing protein [Alcanivorax sp. JB21]|uniref:fibronectin type III domain-containing protein n=1 Tax=Alcanivorax limicola TaxID=2874102 RepID=UPI001CBA8171|nr:fibronectin type III domain-containing protein [Alcanivorax limicola]MBZ2188493.1 fibronectin type III domain-containing protein [Alcanivorax limicola]